MRRDQKGFGVVETLLVLILLSILGFTGYYVYHTRNNTNTTLDGAANTSAITNTPQNKDEETVVGSKAKDALTKLRDDPSSGSLRGYISAHISDGLFTSNFKSLVDSGKYDNTGGNPITCTNGIQPDHFDIGIVTLTGNSAKVTLINTGTDNNHDWSFNPTVTMKYADGNWSVDNLECVANPSAP